MRNDDVTEIIGQIYDLPFDLQPLPRILSEIGHSMGGVGAMILPLDLKSRVSVICSPSLIESMHEYEEVWRPHDSRMRQGIKRGLRAGLVTDRELISESSIRRDPFYQEFLSPRGFGSCLSFLSSREVGETFTITVERGMHAGPASEEQRAYLAKVGRHLSRALSLWASLEDQASLTASLEAALDRMAVATILLDSLGKVIHLNRAAEQVLGRGLTIRERRIICSDAAAQRNFDLAISGVLSPKREGPSGITLIPQTHPLRPLVLQALPIRPAAADRFAQRPFRLGRILLCLHDPNRTGAPSVSVLFRALGLSHGQARIAELVGAGLPVDDVADRLGIKPGSVRQVLKAIYTKLDISRQAQLVALASQFGRMVP